MALVVENLKKKRKRKNRRNAACRRAAYYADWLTTQCRYTLTIFRIETLVHLQHTLDVPCFILFFILILTAVSKTHDVIVMSY